MKNITGATTTLDGIGSRRYTSGARAFHWVIALLIFAVVPLGWMFAEFKTKGKPPTAFEAPFPGPPGDYAAIHKTIGLVIFAMIIARVLYRVFHTPPALPGRMASWEKGMAHASHWLLYAVLVLMPISGYIAASASDHPISVLGLFDFPRLPIPKKPTGETAAEIHLELQFALYALVILHVGATTWHLAVKRDGLLDRMLPRQANAE